MAKDLVGKIKGYGVMSLIISVVIFICPVVVYFVVAGEFTLGRIPPTYAEFLSIFFLPPFSNFYHMLAPVLMLIFPILLLLSSIAVIRLKARGRILLVSAFSIGVLGVIAAMVFGIYELAKSGSVSLLAGLTHFLVIPGILILFIRIMLFFTKDKVKSLFR